MFIGRTKDTSDPLDIQYLALMLQRIEVINFGGPSLAEDKFLAAESSSDDVEKHVKTPAMAGVYHVSRPFILDPHQKP
jgi:hypothetical protein